MNDADRRDLLATPAAPARSGGGPTTVGGLILDWRGHDAQHGKDVSLALGRVK